MKLYNFLILLLLHSSLNEEKTGQEEDLEKAEGIDRIDTDYEEIKILSTEEQVGGSPTFPSHTDTESFELKSLDHFKVTDFGGFRPSQSDIFIENSNIQDKRVVENLDFRTTGVDKNSEVLHESNRFQLTTNVITESPQRLHQVSSYLPQPQSPG